MINQSARDCNLIDCCSGREHRTLARALRAKKRDRRRRAFIASLIRAHALAGAGPITGVEIGVNFGATAIYLLEDCPFIARLLLVDPWQAFPEGHADRQHHAYARRTDARWKDVMNLALDRLPQFGGRAVVSRTTSLEAAKAAAAVGESFWFVYLDGSHAEEDVAADCRAWWPLIVPGGMLCGDDYMPAEHRRGESDPRDGVGRAADAFAAEVERPLVTSARNWFVGKPR